MGSQSASADSVPTGRSAATVSHNGGSGGPSPSRITNGGTSPCTLTLRIRGVRAFWRLVGAWDDRRGQAAMWANVSAHGGGLKQDAISYWSVPEAAISAIALAIGRSSVLAHVRTVD